METSTEMQQTSEDNPAPLNLGGMELTARDTLDYVQTLSGEKSKESIKENLVHKKKLQVISWCLSEF